MHYVPGNYQRNLGQWSVAQQVNGGGTSGGAFIGYPKPAPYVAPAPIAPPTMSIMPIPTTQPIQTWEPSLPYYDPSRTFTYTREQIQQMKDAAIAARGELLERQGREGGDGVYDDLEQKAAEENATEKAIADAAAAMGIPTPADAGSAQAAQNVLPLILAAAAAYFFLM